MKNAFGILFVIQALFINSHARLQGDCHQNYLLLLAHSPLLVKGKITEVEGFRMKLQVFENVWGKLTPGNIDVDVFPNQDDVLESERSVFVFAEKVNDTLYSSGYNGCGVIESRNDSVALGMFYNVNPDVVSESDFLLGMKNIREGKASRLTGASHFSDTLAKVNEDFYNMENNLDYPWWFFLVMASVTTVQMMMFLWH